MARAQLRFTVADAAGSVIQNAAVNVYRPGTTTAVYGTMHSAPTGGSTLTNPLISNAQGEVEAWLETGQSVDLVVTDNGGTAYYPAVPGVPLSMSSFTEKAMAQPGGGLEVTAGAPVALIVQTTDQNVGAFSVQCDNEDGGGLRSVFSVENSNPGPIDVNVRNCVLNIGNPDLSSSSGVPFNWYNDAAANGPVIRVFAPGETTTDPACFSIGVNGDVDIGCSGLASQALSIFDRNLSEHYMDISEFGKIQWGGGTVGTDTSVERVAAKVLAMGTDNSFRTGKAATGSRPTASAAGQGSQFYDTTLGIPIWSNGSVWKDAAGNTV